MPFRGWMEISVVAFALLIAVPDPAPAQDRQESPIRTQIAAADAVRERIDRYFLEAVKNYKNGCVEYDLTIAELEHFSSERGVNSSADKEFGQPVAFSQDFMKSLQNYAKGRLEEFRRFCPPPTQNVQNGEQNPVVMKGGLRADLGASGGMTSVDPPGGGKPDSENMAGSGTIIATIQAPGGLVIVVEDKDGARWISTDRGKTKTYFKPASTATQQSGDGKQGAPADMVHPAKTGTEAGASDTKKDGVSGGHKQRIDGINREIGTIQRGIRDLAGTENPKEAIGQTQTRINEIGEMVDRLEPVAETVGVTARDLIAMKRKWSGEWTVGPMDAVSQGAQEIGQAAALEWFKKRGLNVLPGPVKVASRVADVVNYVGRIVIKKIDMGRFQELIDQEVVKAGDVTELLERLHEERAAERIKLAALNGLEDQLTSAFNARAKEQAHLDMERPATPQAVLGRETDKAGDEKLQRESDRDRVKRGIKRSSDQKTSRSKASAGKGQRISNNEGRAPAPENEVGRQIMQGLIQGGVQYGLGRLGGGGGDGGHSRGDAPMAHRNGQMQNSTAKQGGGAAPSGSMIFYGVTGPGR